MDDAQHPETTAVVSWLEANFGGTVTAVTRQARWRPVWMVDVECDGSTMELCVRGDRRDTDLTWPLDHEMRFQSVLAEQKIPVPAVHGWIDDPGAFVMERVPGRPDFADSSDDERDAVVDEYVQALVAMHQLDIGPFVEAGIDRAKSSDESALIGMARMERMYRNQKTHPDPFLEFGLSWFHRHPPNSHGRECPVVWDSGQFHHADGHLTAIVDLELGHLGDPMMDLAGWRMRDSILGFGSFAAIYDRYGEIAGAPVDLDAIQRHHIAFTLSNQLAFSHALKDPSPDSDFATNMQWCNETNLYATEAIAEYLDVELPTAEMPEPRSSRNAQVHAHLARTLRSVQSDDEYVRYQIRGSFRLAQHVMRVDEIGDALLVADLDDVHELVGRRPDTWHEAEAELERFVLADSSDGRYDVELLQLFHRRNLRAQMLNGPPGSAMARHIPIQSFAR